MTEIENLKASVGIWVNAASSKIEEFMRLSEDTVEDAGQIADLDFKLLGEVQADLDRARKFLVIGDKQNAKRIGRKIKT